MSIKQNDIATDFLEQAPEHVIGELYDWLGLDLSEAYYSEPGANYDDPEKASEFGFELFLNDPMEYLKPEEVLEFMEKTK